MDRTYRITDQPVLIDLGRKGRADVFATVPFIVGTEQHAANVLHLVEARRRGYVVLQALREGREGAIKVSTR